MSRKTTDFIRNDNDRASVRTAVRCELITLENRKRTINRAPKKLGPWYLEKTIDIIRET